MHEIVFALQFTGAAVPVPGHDKRLRVTATATGLSLRSVIKPGGVEVTMETVSGGETARFESEVELVNDHRFVESGTITFGSAGAITFRTLGQGVLGPSPAPGTQQGAVLWEITGGHGRVNGAQGLIVSNFTVTADGQVADNHLARVYLP